MESETQAGPAGAALPLPPMKWDAWGDPALAKELSADVKALLAAALGVTGDAAPGPGADEVLLHPSRLTAEDLKALAAVVGEAHVSAADADRLPRAGGKSTPDLLRRRSREPQDAPDAVVLPGSEDEITALLALCAERRIAVVPFGGGTSVVGGLDPERGGLAAVVSLDLRRFDALLDLDETSGEAVLGAGLTGPAAEALLAERGFELGHYPQSFRFATIGGFAATRSSGQDSAGYGRFDEMVRGLRVVTPAGVLDLGRAPASAAGPDLRELFLGSEGTLGIITAVRVRIHPVPAAKAYEAWSFPDFATGTAALRAVEQQGTGPTVIRLSDEAETMVNLAMTEKIGGEPAVTGCLAVTVFEGTPEQVAARHELTRTALLAAGGTSLGEAPARAWEHGRFNAPYLRDSLLSAGALCETLETATDWRRLSDLRFAVTAALTEALPGALVLCHISHVYPTGASLYFTVVAALGSDPLTQWAGAKRAACDAIAAQGATITHHHAVGADHRPWMTDEVGELGVRILRAVKAELDPAGILNPGKLIP
ncbi:FAD-binding oxidoreductase [Kitasatospora sp. CM 4170]|uniref:FAD-binding oxidoreductase n=1 Tax=Kitasatospora aburaviensis TaxID=67265 RepID=A0ABW1FA64_9ACTN|nr:FAD-binding oxidoreductase [Kitasatospora sp. CM 4170]WNM48363.1 FAD-binding oxidoreductase [Kitasatospora sp. CM 4170]